MSQEEILFQLLNSNKANGILTARNIQAIEGLTQKLDELSEKPQPVKINFNPDEFFFTEIGRAITTAQVKGNADLTFENPRDKDSSISEISFVPNGNFRTKGMIEITVNDVSVYKNKAVADFTDIESDEIPVIKGKVIKRGKKVKVFIWSPDGTSIALTVRVQFGET